MVENLGRRTILIVVLLVISALSLVLPEEPFRLGLDLRGGTRLVYFIDWEEAKAQGLIDDSQDRAVLLKSTLDILRERVDPQGVLEAKFSPQGDSRFVIEIPSTANLQGSEATAILGEAIDALQSSLTLQLDDEEMLALFSTQGGKVHIDQEMIGYGGRQDKLLLGLRRGIDGTTSSRHEAGALLELKGEDPIRSLIENPGSMKFYIGAKAEDFPTGTDLTTEQQNAEQWRQDNPDTPISAYNQQLANSTGPEKLRSLRAFPRRVIDEAGQTHEGPLTLLWNPQSDNPKWSFTGDDLEGVNKTQDRLGFPAVGLRLNITKEFDFGDFTGDNLGELMAIVLNDVCVSLATIETRLGAEFIIKGDFTQAEVDEMVKVLKSGSLIVKPELEHLERVGAALGDQYVKTGFLSMGIGLVLVLIFMVGYYRKLGLFAATSLLCSLVMLLGCMAFLRATLTLPGIAGIILTVGMAVDANILVYERIREELRRGRKLAQACENGFNRAFVTIIDANLTTFITAFILYQVGTGPVRGFATTLMIGIITAVFAALVITRVLVHVSLARGTERFSMGQIIGETSIGFMARTRVALACSLVLILAGVGLFFSMPESQTMSIDFVGGLTVTVRTEEPQQVGTIRERIAGIDGDLGKSADVVELRASGNEEDGYKSFRITYKSLVDVTKTDQATGAEDTGEDDIHEALVDLLQRGPVEARLSDETGASGRLYFEEAHEPADIQARLADGGYGEVTVAMVEGFENRFEFETTETPVASEVNLVPSISGLFSNKKDSTGRDINLAHPMPESSIVGAQVVGELRDKAILAILISLFAVVMYIRMRFAEYSFGFAAVAALVHDVLMTVGALAVCIKFGLVEAEISLPMIAAFLTIIGYSLNDTIVVFDRIRENRPRMKGELSEVLDTSINQTLSRTLLTSVTTLVAVSIMFFFNYGSGSVLEGFAFALCFGVIVGTYSSIFVASPALMLFENWSKKRAAASSS